ncbi:MAG: PepSY-like domain-containing protein [Bacteroidales bacterium]|nr:PepSY-like domain-containing protein [Bacteroidales bacterium]
MKKNAFILAALLMTFSFTAFSQSRVPAVVKTAFSKKFPAVKKAHWAMEGKTEWEAEFKMNGKDMSANFDMQGNWKETETTLKDTRLSTPVMETLSSQFPGYTVNDVSYTETPKYSAYEIVIEKGKSKLEVTIDKKGTLIGKESATDEND